MEELKRYSLQWLKLPQFFVFVSFLTPLESAFKRQWVYNLYVYSFTGHKAVETFLAAFDTPFQFQILALAFLTLSLHVTVMFL